MTRPTEREQEILRTLALRIDEADPTAHAQLGILYHRRGMLDEGLAQLRLALQLDPYHLDALVALGEVLVEAGHPADARRAFRRAVNVRPDHAGALAALAALEAPPEPRARRSA